jgi:hypothetical protein
MFMNIDEIQEEIEKLPVTDRQLLLERLLLGSDAPSSEALNHLTISKEKGHLNVEGGDILIQDCHGEFRNNPKITIYHKNGDEEHISILSQVRSNPRGLFHPAILLALYRWQEIIRCHHSLERATFRKPANYKDFSSIAKNHIKNVMEALIEGAKERAVPVEAALYLIEYGWGMSLDHYALQWVWEQMADPAIKKKQTNHETLKALRKRLNEARGDERPLSKAGMHEVFHFLEHEGSSFLVRRPSRRVMENAFYRSRFGLTAGTVKKYRNKGRVEIRKSSIDIRFIRLDLPCKFFFSELPPFMNSTNMGSKKA